MDISVLYKSKDYATILEYFETSYLSASDSDKYYLGLSLFELGYKREGADLLVDTVTRLRNDDCSRGMGYIGLSFFSIGEYIQATDWLYKSATLMGEFSSESSKWLKLLHLSESARPAAFHENEYMRFHYVDCFSPVTRDEFEKNYTAAYVQLMSFFEVKLPKKIDVFIYNGHKDSIGGNLSYANPPLETIHVYIFEDCGHELAHVVSNYIPGGISVKSPFVDEGIAEYFNRTKYYTNFDQNNHNIDIFDLWANFRAYDRNYSHAIAKRFFSELIECGGKKRALALLHEQTIANAQKIYGKLLFEIKKHTELDVFNGRFDCPANNK